MKHNIIALIGMMGSGKSTIAMQLAKKLNFNLFELDEIFEEENKIK
ncbi:MAG: AAA family ATPase, partial [Candidatus Gastranaerophilales bacterium]|nr:AAA family ATPase [Candidatus Gastranaerophilales bacterium]